MYLRKFLGIAMRRMSEARGLCNEFWVIWQSINLFFTKRSSVRKNGVGDT